MLFSLYAVLAFLLAAAVVCIHLGFWLLPLALFALGLLTGLWRPRAALLLFLFLIPLVNATPDLFFNGYPFNYMGVVLFHLAGLLAAARLRGHPLRPTGRWARPYLFFLSVVVVSVLFLFLRWSNLHLSTLAFLRDTPVATSGERISFAVIFPVITLFIFALAPFVPALLQRQRLSPARALRPLAAGFLVSLGLALVQRFVAPDLLAQGWWVKSLRQPNGGFSDFNAFGFFAGALCLYAMVLAVHFHRRVADRRGRRRLAFILFLLVAALGGVFLSGCRTALLFVLVGCVHVFFSRRVARLWKIAGVTVLAALLIVAGGTLRNRLRVFLDHFLQARNVSQWLAAADTFSNTRIAMVRRSLPMIAMAPVSGVGAGNFLFCFKSLYFGRDFYEDLTLNHYLLVLDELGSVGLLFFLWWLGAAVRRRRPSPWRVVNAGMLLALLFNNFFWFPEVALLFWVVNARAEAASAAAAPLRRRWLAPALVLLFVASQVESFARLQPLRFTQKHDQPYLYGLDRAEWDERGEFRWSGSAAGRYLAGADRGVRICSDAPFSRLPGGVQTVDLYWRGRWQRRLTFTSPRCESLAVGGEGFLELRVHPAYNLRSLGLGAETRTLGVRVYVERQE